MSNLTAIIANALQLSPLTNSPAECPPGTICQISGETITSGYRVQDVITDATGEFLDTFRGNPHGWISESTARCYRAVSTGGGNLCCRAMMCFGDGTGYLPMIARESAESQGRPCWSDLVREIWPHRAGKHCVIILSTDTKKRLWPRARATVLGHNTTVYVHDTKLNISANITVNWPEMLHDLDIVEQIYSAGFSKEVIAHTLYSQYNLCRQIGMSRAQAWERELEQIRSREWFPFVLIIAQKSRQLEEDNNDVRNTICADISDPTNDNSRNAINCNDANQPSRPCSSGQQQRFAF